MKKVVLFSLMLIFFTVSMTMGMSIPKDQSQKETVQLVTHQMDLTIVNVNIDVMDAGNVLMDEISQNIKIPIMVQNYVLQTFGDKTVLQTFTITNNYNISNTVAENIPILFNEFSFNIISVPISARCVHIESLFGNRDLIYRSNYKERNIVMKARGQSFIRHVHRVSC